jgi:hypothetical protein
MNNNICKRLPKDLDCHYIRHKQYDVIYFKQIDDLVYCNQSQFEFVKGNYRIFMIVSNDDEHKRSYNITFELMKSEEDYNDKSLIRVLFKKASFHFKKHERLSIRFEEVEYLLPKTQLNKER